MSNFSSVKRWETIGFFWIVIVGSMLHFTFELSGSSRFVALFSAVNESVWEHLKLGYFSLAFFMLIEYWFIRDKTNSFFMPKFIGIVSMSLFIVIVFYSYEAITGSHNLLIDIGSFILGALLCQLISFKIMVQNIEFPNYLGLILFIILGIVFMIFTFYPPHLPIFLDSRGFYGIMNKHK